MSLTFTYTYVHLQEIEAVMSGMDFPLSDSDYPIPRGA